MLLDKTDTLDIPCPVCGTETTLSVSNIELNPSYTCGECNCVINLDASKFVAGMEDADNQLRDFERDLVNIFK